MYATGGTQSPIRFVVYLHLVAVSLLASYRTGLKIALWHSLLLFVLLYAQAARLVTAIEVTPGVGIEFDRMPVLNVTSFWLFAIATSIFSALNERELRQRRADLQALVDVGAKLDTVADAIRQAELVLEVARGTLRLRARRAARRVRPAGRRPRDARHGRGADDLERARLDRQPRLGAPRDPAGQAPRPDARPVPRRTSCPARGTSSSRR